MRGRTRGTILALAALAALGAACDDTVAPRLATEGPPRALRAEYGGFGYGTKAVVLRGDTLVVTRRQWAERDSAVTRTLVPDAAAWRAFWASAAEARVTRWPRRCLNALIADGGGLSLELGLAGGTIAGTYTNASPRANGGCTTDGSTSPEERTFAAAVARLIGEPFP